MRNAAKLDVRLVTGQEIDQIDMMVAARVYEAMLGNRLTLLLQPVMKVGAPCDRLYMECFVSVAADDDHAIPRERFAPALERLGLIRLFDRYMLRKVFGLLNRCRDLSIGVNISSRSVVQDDFWTATMLELSRSRQVAERLVIEVSEAEQFKLGDARSLTTRLQRLGCRVAVDGFGLGYGVEMGREILAPDIIKIDASMIRKARYGREGLGRLSRMVKLAASMSRNVAVEGVDSESDLAVARACGVTWAQGDYFGRPALLRKGIAGDVIATERQGSGTA